MKVCIIGWYGTETMGDRAILDGILSVLNEIDKESIVAIGSLFPFYSERTLYEEREVLRRTSPYMQFRIFNSKEKQSCRKEISETDLVIMGGGPIMDLEELFIVKNCFRLAKKNRIPAVIMGCGLGPINKRDYIHCIKDIFDLSTAIAFRDNKSKKLALKEFGDCYGYECLGDPAIISIENYKKTCNFGEKNGISVNLRKYPMEYGSKVYISDNDIKRFLFNLSERYGVIDLVPMHTFSIGGDDRKYFADLLYAENNKKIRVIHEPQNLDELYHNYMSSKFCIGMRYHSVVMQTILNGNNYIINYTNPINGKIVGFLEDIDQNGFYKNRIVDMQLSNAGYALENLLNSMSDENVFQYKYSNIKQDYIVWLRNVLRIS